MNKQTLRIIIFVGLFSIPLIPFLFYGGFFFPYITTKVFIWRILVEVIFAAWILLALSDLDYRPKKSLILYAVLGFLMIIGLADLFGVDPEKSFWSNFERMEGFISLLHLGMFFLVISTVFKEIDWKHWWNVSLVASFLMVIYSVLQIMGLQKINQGGVRVDGTLGNAIYLAVYMLFHIFMTTLFMWRERKNVVLRWIYGLLIFFQTFVLYYTATRGAILGLLGGFLVLAVLSIFNKDESEKIVRKIGIVTLLVLVVIIGGFFAAKDTTFITSSPVLSRFASLTTNEIKTQGRYFVWPMAIEGFKKHPFLGWGQENFTYVFQEHYSPDMFSLEPWFDRVHNIFLDWLVVGGLFGLLSYLALYLALFYYIWNKDATLAHTEKSLLTGLVAAYFFHNVFVFDHLISYILFFSLLAYIQYRHSGSVISTKVIQTNQILLVGLPITSLLLLCTLYFVNIKPIVANVFLINALKSMQTPGQIRTAMEYFKKSYDVAYLGRSEMVEHLAANTATILTSDISMDEKNTFFTFAKDAVLKQAQDVEHDSRYQLMAGSFLSTTGQLDESLVYLNRAHELIPGKQQVYFEIGATYINKQEPQQALKVFKEAYDLAPAYAESRITYLVGAIYAGSRSTENELLNLSTEKEIVFDDRIINAYYALGRIDRVINLLKERIRLDPKHTDTYQKYLETIVNR